MKRIALALLFVCMTSGCPVWAQCESEIKDVRQDEQRGSMIVEVEYKLNSKVINVFLEECELKDGDYIDSRGVLCLGRSRYDEKNPLTSEDWVLADLITFAESDIERHRENIIKGIPINVIYINTEIVKRQKELTTPIIPDLKSALVGVKGTTTEAIKTFKGKNIKVTYDSKNTVSDSISP